MPERKFLFLCVTCLMAMTAFLVSCSLKPSAGRAKEDLQKWLDGRWPDTLSVVEYRAMSTEEEGGKYTIIYAAKARFIKDTAGCVLTCCGKVCFDKFLVEFRRWTAKASPDPHIIRKGDMFEMEGRSVYKKTEKGWLSEGS